MNKLELVTQLKEKTDLTKQESIDVVNTFFDLLTKAFIKDERFEIRDFCSFHVRKYRGYIGRNPKTGEKVKILPKRLPFFKCSKKLKKQVNY